MIDLDVVVLDLLLGIIIGLLWRIAKELKFIKMHCAADALKNMSSNLCEFANKKLAELVVEKKEDVQA